MSGISEIFQNWQKVISGRNFVVRGVIFAVFASTVLLLLANESNAETRKLKIYYLHTGEKATVAFKKNGTYLPAGLKRINYLLRDWRRNEPTRMDPNLLDMVWEVYQKSGSKDYIHVISGYRSPATNNMLRKRGRGVAKKSQHTFGKALDFFLPDVKLAKLRKIGLIKQAGGIGYYPRSGSPFVHMDTGRVRHWPRMTRTELVRIFPNGKTLHIPTDGKPLPGYNQAVAAYNGRKSSGKRIKSAKGTEKERKSFFARLASLGNDEREDNTVNRVPAPKKVKTTSKVVKKTTAAGQIAGPQLPKNNPAKPELPLIANIPIPRPDPRDIALAHNNLNDNNRVENFAVDRFDGNNAIVTLTTASNIMAPTPVLRPAFGSVNVANVDPSRLSRRTGELDQTNPDNNRSGDASTKLAAITTRQLRNQLIEQATNQLRAELTAPIPDADVGSSFETALLAPQIKTVASKNPVLTRSLRPVPTSRDAENQIDREFTGDVNVGFRNTLPVILASLSNLNEDTIRSPMAIPAPRPKTKSTQWQPSNDSNLTLARLKEDAGNTEFLDELRASMEKQSQELIESRNLEPAKTKPSHSISGIILAAIPTPSPRLSKLDEDLYRNESSQTQIAIMQSGNSTYENDGLTPNTTPYPLDELSLSWYENKRTGKFVLANSLSIKATDELRAPAYGRAAIRQSPKTVLTVGFIPEASVQNSSRFTGNAVRFQTFTKFN